MAEPYPAAEHAADRSGGLRRSAGSSFGTRLRSPWPLRAYFAVLLALFVAVAGSATVYVYVQADRDARASARHDAAFAARTAAGQLGDGVAVVKATVAQLATSLQTQTIPRHLSPACALTFAGAGGFESGHLDIMRPDGEVVCSSRARPGDRRLPGYAAAAWVERARRGPVFLAPIVDQATRAQVALAAAPVGKRAIVAAFVDLAPAAHTLATLYGGGRPVELLLTDREGRTILSRSIAPARWVGSPLAGTPFAAAGGTDRPDVDGRPRLYSEASVPGVGWRLFVGVDRASALAAGNRLRNRQLGIVLGGLVVVLVVMFVIYRRVAVPIARLREAVASSDPYAASAPGIPASGPQEVAALANEVNALISAVGRELQERRRAEDSARASESNYRLLFESSPLPMAICDAETSRILEVNDAAVVHYGYTRDELLALSVMDLVAPADHAMLRQVLAESKPSQRLGPLRHTTKDGTEIEVRITSYLVTFGVRRARFLLLEDVSERERFERQLRQSQRLESLGQLAGGVAHDFNNLLGVIVGFASFAREQAASMQGGVNGESAELSRSIDQIERAAERAGSLTHQLLAFARREVVTPTSVDIGEVVGGLEPMLRRTLGDHIDLVASLEDDLWPIEIDRTQLEQVLVNLAVNARDAMPDGGPLAIDTSNVTVDAHYAESRPGVATGRYVRLRVSDAGTGMDEATLQRAFEPFYTTKPPGSGTGLGLATVYGIVTQAGGRVQIYSEPGHGTTVTVLFPAAEGSAAATASTPQAERTGGNETILVVEDEDALREVTERMLRRNGYQVLTAADGAAAMQLAAAGAGTIDLLLTDVVMPRMLGREVAARVVELQPHIRVLYISGYAEPILGSQGTLEPDVQLLEKPFSEPALLAKLREVLDAPRA